MTVLTYEELRERVAARWNPKPPPAATARFIRTAADLEVGDYLRRPGGQTDVLVTRLNPEGREETLLEGRREVWSYSSCWVFDADELVQAYARDDAAVTA